MLNKCKTFEPSSKIKRLIKMGVELPSLETTILEKKLEKQMQEVELMLETKVKMFQGHNRQRRHLMLMLWLKANLNTITKVQLRLEMTVYIKIKTKELVPWRNNQVRATPSWKAKVWLYSKILWLLILKVKFNKIEAKV